MTSVRRRQARLALLGVVLSVLASAVVWQQWRRGVFSEGRRVLLAFTSALRAQDFATASGLVPPGALCQEPDGEWKVMCSCGSHGVPAAAFARRNLSFIVLRGGGRGDRVSLRGLGGYLDVKDGRIVRIKLM